MISDVTVTDINIPKPQDFVARTIFVLLIIVSDSVLVLVMLVRMSGFDLPCLAQIRIPNHKPSIVVFQGA